MKGLFGRTKRVLVGLVGFVAIGMPAHAERLPQLMATSQTPRVTIIDANIETVETADRTRLYRLRFDLAKRQGPITEVAVEYELQDVVTRQYLGGGSFTLTPQMVEQGGRAVTALVGFSGIEFQPSHVVTTRLVDEPWSKSGGITDTCTTFCDMCTDKAAALCTQGVATVDCSCSDTFRNCKFTCGSGSGGSRPGN